MDDYPQASLLDLHSGAQSQAVIVGRPRSTSSPHGRPFYLPQYGTDSATSEHSHKYGGSTYTSGDVGHENSTDTSKRRSLPSPASAWHSLEPQQLAPLFSFDEMDHQPTSADNGTGSSRYPQINVMEVQTNTQVGTNHGTASFPQAMELSQSQASAGSSFPPTPSSEFSLPWGSSTHEQLLLAASALNSLSDQGGDSSPFAYQPVVPDPNRLLPFSDPQTLPSRPSTAPSIPPSHETDYPRPKKAPSVGARFKPIPQELPQEQREMISGKRDAWRAYQANHRNKEKRILEDKVASLEEAVKTLTRENLANRNEYQALLAEYQRLKGKLEMQTEMMDRYAFIFAPNQVAPLE